jgi:dsRNA-specific ribonuclease
LETYGDTILKLAATLLAYNHLENDPRAGENKVARLKDAFVTNMFLYKVGKNLELNRFMRREDPDPKKWSPPFFVQDVPETTLSCTGKNMADGVEAILGAMFMSTDLFTTLQFISDIQLVPLH